MNRWRSFPLAVPLFAVALALPAWAGALWVDIPFVAQPEEGCGAAVISMVMQYWDLQGGREPRPASEVDGIQKALYSRKDRGISSNAMQGYFQANGFRVMAYRGDWDHLYRQIERGRPPIVALAPAGPRAPLHYAVLAGIDSERNFVFLNDPARGKLLRLSREAFETEWKAVDHWTLLALPLPSN